MKTDSVDHEAALRLIHSGKIFPGRPAWGSWVLYGLGTERQDLPAYVVLSDPGGLPVDGTNNWSTGFLPAVYQGTPFRAAGTPVAHLATAGRRARRPHGATSSTCSTSLNAAAPPQRHPRQRRTGGAHRPLRTGRPDADRGARRARHLEGDRGDAASCTALDNPKRAEYGKRCLLARRLVERGVRFVQIFLSGQPWDTHSKNAESLKDLVRDDRPARAPGWCTT